MIALGSSPRYLHWWAGTPPEAPAPLPRLRNLKPDQVGYAAFIVTGIEGDQNGNYSYSVSWKLVGPDGKLVLAYPEYAKGEGKLHRRPSFYMGDPALDIMLESSDPVGEYVLEATAIDNVSGKKAKTSYRIRFGVSTEKDEREKRSHGVMYDGGRSQPLLRPRGKHEPDGEMGTEGLVLDRSVPVCGVFIRNR